MHLDMNDPVITTYALGELDAVQTAALDEHVRECESCRQAVAEIRDLAAAITKELAVTELPAEKQPKLQPAQREAVEQRLATTSRPRLVSNKLFLALAASLLVAVGAGVSMYWIAPDKGPVMASHTPLEGERVAYAPNRTLKNGEFAENGRVSDEPGQPTKYEAMWQNSVLDKTSGQGGHPGNVAGGPQPAAAGKHAAPTGITTVPRPNADRNVYFTGGDNAPVAPMAELHAPNLTTTSPATTTAAALPPDPFRTVSPSSGVPGPKGEHKFTGSATTTTNPGPASTSGSASTTPVAGPAAAPAVPGGTPTTTAPHRDYTVVKPTYETKPGKDAPDQGTTTGAPYNMPEAKTWKELNAPRSETKPSAADFGKPSGTAHEIGELPKARDPRDPRLMAQFNQGDAAEQERRAKAGGILQLRGNEFTENTQVNQELYAPVVDNAFLPALQNSLSTFSIDVDTASYANVRRMLGAGQRPPKDAVRIEEMVNYFTYDYTPPKDDRPFSAHVEMADCPWHGEHRLVRIGLKGKDLGAERRPACNLVFLLDVSGSMNAPNKLPLVKESMRLLISRLNEEDNVAIVVYAGASGLALPSTSCEQKQKILAAIDHLQAGGSTNGGAGIQLAYDTAAGQFIRGGVNRVILCTDGDFNVGITSQEALTKLIQEKAKGGVFLSVLGFGMGNLKDSTLEKLADLGNGNYAYIDSQEEARKVLVRQLNGTLVTIAKDVKIQVEFNPAVVSQYRLIGYENRMLKAEDFNNDKKDAGEIGAGHTVTALYEIVPVIRAGGAKSPEVDSLKYQKPAPVEGVVTDEVMTLKLRYKAPDGDTSKLIEFPVKDEVKKLGQASGDFRFAASVAAFGMLLRNSEHRGSATWDGVIELAGEPMSAADQKEDQADELKARLEFLDIVRRAKQVVGD